MNTDVIIIGAGAAGLMCAISAAKRGRKVIILDSANKAGKKILMSGGGRCNFTNLSIEPENYICRNPHFHKSALSRFSQWDFIEMVQQHKIAYVEKNVGELFCVNKSRDILQMLLDECKEYAVEIILNCKINNIKKILEQFEIYTNNKSYNCQSLVIATGGLSIPKMGATGFGYEIAKQFGHTILPLSAALVPFTLIESMKYDFTDLAGTSVKVTASCNNQIFRGSMLFTHRGLSGPVILQISSYWQQGDSIEINLIPDINLAKLMQQQASKDLKWLLQQFFTKKLAQKLLNLWFKDYISKKFTEISRQNREKIAQRLQNWQFKPNGTEGYRTAEVTKGGINTDEISSKTFESKNCKNLHFIGEVLDVTGHLGGYNFQWAWSSAYCAGQFV
ncbi:MAG TPA: NAD(P)/FAD-dependent oxidoreductase [Oceanospirillales bacterium]|nr:NAD(P)/FAD-dependent oxidoreductase [Oceanospirillales bacterium]